MKKKAVDVLPKYTQLSLVIQVYSIWLKKCINCFDERVVPKINVGYFTVYYAV